MRFNNQLINESSPGACQAVLATTTVASTDYLPVCADGRVILRVHLHSVKSVHLEGGQGLRRAPGYATYASPSSEKRDPSELFLRPGLRRSGRGRSERYARAVLDRLGTLLAME